MWDPKVARQELSSAQLECQLLRDEIMQKLEYGYKIRAAMYGSVALITAYLYGQTSPEPLLFLLPLFIILACFIENNDAIGAAFSISTYLVVFYNDIFKWEGRIIKRRTLTKNRDNKQLFKIDVHTKPYILSSLFCITNSIFFCFKTNDMSRLCIIILILFLFFIIFTRTKDIFKIKSGREYHELYMPDWERVKEEESELQVRQNCNKKSSDE